MKKILFIGLLLSIALTISAQHQMQVWQDGVPTSFAVAEVDSITFGKNSTYIDTIPNLWLDTSDIYILDLIFDSSNPKLRNLVEDTVYTISSGDELLKLCPEGLQCPNVDFSKSGIVYSVIKIPSISDEFVSSELTYNKESDALNFVVTIQECLDCWDAIGYIYPYGIYEASYIQKPIKLKIINL